MKKSHNILIPVYFGMLAFCIWLNRTSTDYVGMVINALLFIIAGGLFVWSYRKFKKIHSLINDLSTATNKITEEYKTSNSLLWNKYKAVEENNLFTDKILVEEYNKYLSEMKRLESSNSTYKCDISDFINTELIDVLVRKNIMNLVSGTMTGLGILGTFVGLTFGLDKFNTGTAAEISESIAPLMDGIKVAFHTSIFGMIFSLFFSFVFKSVLENAYNNIENFTYTYSRYVTGDSSNDNENTVHTLIRELPEQLSLQLRDIFHPQFEKMNTTLEAFAKSVDDRQLESISSLVDAFTNGLNESLGNSFTKLGDIISETCEIQEKNNEISHTILEKLNGMTQNIVEINNLCNNTIERLSGYISEVEKLQDVINQNFMSVNLQLDEHHKSEEKMQGYMAELVNFEKQIGEASETFTKGITEQLDVLKNLEKDFSEHSKNTVETIASNASESIKQLGEATEGFKNSIAGQFDILKNLESDFTEHSKNTVESLAENVSKYNEQIADSAKKQIEEISSVSSVSTGELERAAQELGKTSKMLTRQLETSLHNTFDIFDKNLAEISMHLSGTIAEIKDTTDRVPETVRAAYEGMGSSFTDMQTNLEEIVSSLYVMRSNMKDLTEKFIKE